MLTFKILSASEIASSFRFFEQWQKLQYNALHRLWHRATGCSGAKTLLLTTPQ